VGIQSPQRENTYTIDDCAAQAYCLVGTKEVPSMQRIALFLGAASLGFLGMAQSATLPFTFTSSANASFVGIPSQANLSLPTTTSGSASFGPLGLALYSEAGTITFRMLPSGAFVPVAVMNNFSAVFNGGADSFTGTDSAIFGPPNALGLPTFTNTEVILGGTGIFAGATGFFTGGGVAIRPSGPETPGQVTLLSSTGSGQITAPGLNTAPEPATVALLGAGLTGVAALRRKRRGSQE
jgi:hypothetical protein